MTHQPVQKTFIATFSSLLLAFTAVSICLWLLMPSAQVQGQEDSGVKGEKVNEPPPDQPKIVTPESRGPTANLMPPPRVGLTETPYWLGVDVDGSFDAAWGDVDGDGDLDLAIANDAFNGNGASKLYRNEGGILQDNPIWESTDTNEGATSVAWGDVNGDGALDLAIGDYYSFNKVYLNDRGSLQNTPVWTSNETAVTSIVWGDINGDGALDLALGIDGGANVIYLNTGTGLDTIPAWTSGDSDSTNSIALVDTNGDGWLDLAIGNANQPNVLFMNDGTGNFYNGPVTCLGLWEWGAPTSGPEKAHSGSYVWGTNLAGDYGTDEDEYLTTPPIDLTGVPAGPVTVSWWQWIHTEAGFDFASVEASNNGGASWTEVYAVSGVVTGTNNNYVNQTVPLAPTFAVNNFQLRFRLQSDFIIQFPGFYVDDVSIEVNGFELYSENFETSDGGYGALPTGVRCIGADADNTQSIAFGDVDGDGDPDLAVGNWSEPNKIYANNVGGSQWALIWSSLESEFTYDVDWGDVDGDGDLDLAAADSGAGNKVYLNNEGIFEATAVWQSDDEDFNQSVAWGDMNGDGTLDLAVANSNGPNKVYLNNATLLQTTADNGWLSASADFSEAVAWGDMNGDGLLDLAVGNDGFNQVYLNISGTLDITPVWTSSESDWTQSVAWGDVNGDGWLDLAVGNVIDSNRVYLNLGGILETTASWSSNDTDSTYTIAWGDVNGDGHLDLAAGNYLAPNRIYQNSGSSLPVDATWSSNESAGTVGLAFGDIDGDGDLDMAAGNWFEPNQYYLNNGDGLQASAAWESADADKTWSVAWGDMNGDGRLDLAAGNDTGPNRVYLNQGGNLDPVAAWQSGDTNSTLSIAWGDVNGDGWPDLAAGNYGDANRVYLNRQGVLQTAANNPWVSADSDFTYAVAWGDMNRDGHLDLAAANATGANKVYLGSRPAHPFYGGQTVAIAFDYTLTPADLFAVANIQDSGTVPISYTLFHPASEPVREIRASYSLDGGQNWQPAVAAGGTMTTNLAASPYPSAPVFCSTPSSAIPDNDPTGVADTMNVSFLGPITDIEVAIAANHTWVGDLSFALEHVDTGTAVTIFDQPGVPATTFGCSENDIDVVLDDQAALPVEDQCSLTPPAIQGELMPNNPLSTFAGENFSGDWTLTAVDHVGGDTGTLVEWCLLSAAFAAPAPLGTITNTHIFEWDVYGSGFFGQSDNVMFRLEALPELRTQANHIPGPFQRPIIASQTYPFRVRGTQIQVISGTLPAANALIYRVEAGQVANGDPIANNAGVPFRTNAQGLLQGRGELTAGDNLVALLPQTGTTTTSACSSPNLAIPDDDPNGVSDSLVIDSGGTIQDLNVSINATHTWVGDLIFTLQHAESGTSITLMDRPGVPNTIYGCSGDNINATFDDEANVPVEDQCGSNPPAIYGDVQPEELLTAFAGEDFSGTWTLTVSDHASPDPGTLVEWCLLSESQEESYTLYHTSAAPTETGLDMYTFAGGGLQTLAVTADNPLLLFDLDLALEWDARNDGLFLTDLQDAVREASTVLYDVSNGQIAIGEVRLHQNRANWLTSDVVIYASSNMRPRAAMGGIVVTGTNDINASGTITNAYLPGQVTMGPIWDPFGENQFDLGQEWWRALAHELAHYLLFLPDNYVGVSESGGLIGIDCQGSFMTNTSDDSYSEFLTEAGWTGVCLQSIAEQVTGRYDWETVTEFYPMLSGTGGNIGPSVLPINVTKVTVSSPAAVATAVPVRNFDLRNAQTNALISLPQAQGYILRGQNTPDLSDDSLIDLGATRGGGDRIKVRGAEPGDRLCVSGLHSGELWQGCEAITENSSSILVAPLPGWNPNILVTPVNTRTIRITVTQAVASGNLSAQLIPAYGSQADQTIFNSPWTAMVPLGNDSYAAVLTVDYPTFQGTVRIWEPGTAHETISRYVLDTTTWGGSLRGWNGGSLRGWNGGSLRGWNGAPSVSGDGQLTVFNVNDPYGETGVSALQSLSVVPALPSWLTLVGQGYVVVETADFANNVPRTLAYDYLQRDVPDGYEYALNIYFLAEGSTAWQRLVTTVDSDENRAIADMPLDGGGIYALVATIELPGLSEGWNLLAYPVPATRTVGLALASIEADYTTVVQEDGAGSWLVHDQTVLRDHPDFAPYINTLAHLTFGHSYWIYALTDTIPFIGVPDETRLEAPAVALPPGQFYGWVVPPNGVVVTAGDTVTAVIDGVTCGTGTVTNTVSPGLLAYKLFVKADSGDGCGANGRVINFIINGYTFPDLFVRPVTIDWNRQAWFHPLGLGQRIYMPLINKNAQHLAPDLVVESVTILSEDVQVVIANQGNKPVPATASYWIDLYVNPTSVPKVNQPWQTISSEGAVWGVTGVALVPGATLTLTLHDSYYSASFSNYAGEPTPGTVIYVQVDSWNPATNYGVVLETHELLGGAYNNVTGVLYLPQ